MDAINEHETGDLWVFGYGSLMWKGWERAHGCVRCADAELPGFRRAFNKGSVKNWGTKQNPGPTLDLEADSSISCRGVAFEFPDDKSNRIRAYLEKREAKDFSLCEKEILVAGHRARALVPIYAGKNLLNETLKDRAKMARAAEGNCGRCIDYVKGVLDELSKLGIDDPAVKEFWQAVNAP